MKIDTVQSISAPVFAIGGSVKRKVSTGPTFGGVWTVQSVTPDGKYAKYHEYRLTNDRGLKMAAFECDLVPA